MGLLSVLRTGAAVVLLPLLTVQPSFGWGMDGHLMINRVVGALLPADLPAFLRTPAALDEIEYLGPEPDRWRDKSEPELVAAQAPEHYMHMEPLQWLQGPLATKRYDFVRQAYAAQIAHPEHANELTPEHIGFQPWVTIEVWERLKAAMRNYRTLEKEHKNTKPAEALVIFYAGWLGHYVADGANPQHTTDKHDGWVGDNPNGYTTEHGIHARFESKFVKANVKPAEIAELVAKEPKLLADPFSDYMAYLKSSHSKLEKLYQLDKEHGFDNAGTPESKRFVVECMAAGATELRDMIYTAWVRSADPVPSYKG